MKERDPLVWGAARMLRVCIEKRARAEEVPTNAKQAGTELYQCLRDEGLAKYEIRALIEALQAELEK